MKVHIQQNPFPGVKIDGSDTKTSSKVYDNSFQEIFFGKESLEMRIGKYLDAD